MNKNYWTTLGFTLATSLGLTLVSGLSLSAAALAQTRVEAANTSTAKNSLSDYTSFKFGDAATLKLNALIQGWAIGNENDLHAVKKAAPANQDFRLRRAEIKFSGTIANAPKYFLMVDPARLVLQTSNPTFTRTTMIQDFGLSYALVPGLEVTAGQFKSPTTAEGLDSSGDLPLPERSLVGRTHGDKREMGVKVGYKTTVVNVASMVSSGRPISVNGTGAFNDLHSRVEVTPVKNLGLGTFLTVGENFNYSAKGRWGLNARYRLGQADLRAEYAQAKDRAVQSHGLTTEVGYWLTETLEPVARFESFSANPAFKRDAKAETVGVNYFFREYRTKLQVAGSALQNMSAVNGSTAVANGANNKEVTLMLQTSI